jgi:hypothetical protein
MHIKVIISSTVLYNFGKVLSTIYNSSCTEHSAASWVSIENRFFHKHTPKPEAERYFIHKKSC